MNKKYLKELFANVAALETPSQGLSERAKRLFEEKVLPLLQKEPKVLSRESAKAILLRILDERSLTADEIASEFRSLNLSLENQGIGHILTLLINLEHSNDILGIFNQDKTKRTYQLTTSGRNKVKQLVPELYMLNPATIARWT